MNSLLIAVPPHASRYSERPLSLSSSKETFLNSFFFSFLFVVVVPVLFVRTRFFFNDDDDDEFIIIIIILNTALPKRSSLC